jgi:chromosome segregation ATPase
VTKQTSASKTQETEVEKHQSATKKFEDAAKADAKANGAWNKANDEMKQAEAASTKATKAYTDRMAEIEKIRADLAAEEQRLINAKTEAEKIFSDKALTEKEKKDQALSSGKMKNNTVMALETQRAVVKTAQASLDMQISAAQAASTKAQELRAAATKAASEYGSAAADHQAKKTCRKFIENVIGSVTAFYGDVDTLYDDLYARYMEASDKGNKSYVPWEQLKKHKMLSPVLTKYNSVVLSYKTLGAECPDVYKKVVGTISEVKENSQEQIRSVCDPEDALAEEGNAKEVSQSRDA